LKITEIYIDGFRNISKTKLDFSVEPLIVLLAPNNCGKSNLLLGIQNGFDLIAKQGTHVVNYIQNSDNYVNWNIHNGINAFTFGVRFEKNDKKEGEFYYKYSLNYEVKIAYDEYKNVKLAKSLAHGIFEEQLVCTKDGTQKLIFKRIKSTEEGMNDVVELLDGKIKLIIPGDYRSGKKDYNSSLYFALHKLGNMALLENTPDDLKDVLDNIRGVWTSLTRENIGSIITHEKSDFFTHEVLIQDIKEIKEKDCEHKTNYYGEFISKFKSLFPCYNSDKGVVSGPLGDNGQYELVFRHGKKIRPETVMSLSFGTRRVFKLLSQIFANETPLISLEEIENGMHPELYSGVIEIFFDVLNKKRRFNDPRLILSSHAPGIVNALESHLDSIYVAVPGLINSGTAQFAKLNETGKNKVRKHMNETFFRAGDIIFAVFAEDCLQESNLKMLDMKHEGET